ncbi:hypothetical protein [Microbacterium azadirachtae]|nr:hypothetical protein [Microbacterium azadirachtae]
MVGTRINGHVESCAEAVVTPVEECECACDGAFHGGPHTWRARALIAADEDLATRRSYSGRQVTDVRKGFRNADGAERSMRGTDLLMTIIIEAVVLRDEPDEARRVERGITRIVGPFVDEIANSNLSSEERAQFKLILPELHLLCALCVLVLEAKKEFASAVDAIAGGLIDRLVAEVLGSLPTRLLSDTIRPVLRLAMKKACATFVEWAFESANEKALQVLGILFCPNTEHHPEVRELCIAPLEGEYLNAAIVAWAMEHYPFGRDFISGRSTKGLRL